MAEESSDTVALPGRLREKQALGVDELNGCRVGGMAEAPEDLGPWVQGSPPACWSLPVTSRARALT